MQMIKQKNSIEGELKKPSAEKKRLGCMDCGEIPAA